jgi:hypothetical protein
MKNILTFAGGFEGVENFLNEKLVRADDTTGIQTPLLVSHLIHSRFAFIIQSS